MRDASNDVVCLTDVLWATSSQNICFYEGKSSSDIYHRDLILQMTSFRSCFTTQLTGYYQQKIQKKCLMLT